VTPSQTVRADPRVADLVQAGKIRSALFLPQYIKDEVTGELRGMGPGMVAIELVRGVAARLGVEVLLVGLQTPIEVVERLRTGACDMAFMGITDSRTAEVDFSPPVIQFDFTYLVPAGSSISGVADADRPGVRIAVVRNHASTIALSRLVQHAELVATEIPEAALDMLRAGNAAAFASARDLLVDYSAKLPGSRVLKDAYGVNRTGMAVPKGHSGRLAYINEFIEEAKASGLVQHAIELAGCSEVIQVVPPAKSN
jgi:polar amino acid transport system substrate-binding protein